MTRAWGAHYHGLSKNGRLTLPNGEVVDYPQGPGNYANPRMMSISPPWASGGTPNELEVVEGKTWPPYALISGEGGVVHGDYLGHNCWLWAEAPGKTWNVGFPYLEASYGSQSVTLTLTRYGRVPPLPEGEDETRSITVSFGPTIPGSVKDSQGNTRHGAWPWVTDPGSTYTPQIDLWDAHPVDGSRAVFAAASVGLWSVVEIDLAAESARVTYMHDASGHLEYDSFSVDTSDPGYFASSDMEEITTGSKVCENDNYAVYKRQHVYSMSDRESPPYSARRPTYGYGIDQPLKELVSVRGDTDNDYGQFAGWRPGSASASGGYAMSVGYTATGSLDFILISYSSTVETTPGTVAVTSDLQPTSEWCDKVPSPYAGCECENMYVQTTPSSIATYVEDTATQKDTITIRSTARGEIWSANQSLTLYSNRWRRSYWFGPIDNGLTYDNGTEETAEATLTGTDFNGDTINYTKSVELPEAYDWNSYYTYRRSYDDFHGVRSVRVYRLYPGCVALGGSWACETADIIATHRHVVSPGGCVGWLFGTSIHPITGEVGAPDNYGDYAEWV